MVAESVTAGVGRSQALDAGQAGREAANAALDQLNGAAGVPQLAIVFGSSWYDQSVLIQGIRTVLGELPLIGQSTAAEVAPEGPVTHSCSVLVLAAEAPCCGLGIGYDADARPREAGQRAGYAAVKALPSKSRAGFIAFGDGARTNPREVLLGLQEVLGTSFPIAGGLTGDEQGQGSLQYCLNDICARSVAGVLLGGPVRLGAGIEHGFAPISKPRRITGARANVLLTLDHQPAASVYEEYFGAEAVERIRQEGRSRQTIAYPLGVQSSSAHHWLLRNVVSVGADGSLACTGDLAEGAWLQLMIGSRELALEAARRAAHQAIQPLNHVAAVLVFDSLSRRTLLGAHHAAMEIAAIRDVVGPAAPLAGCYTYAEEGPFVAAASAGGPESLQVAMQTGSVCVVALGS